MGVQGLWELLAPVGRRVSVETLAGKRLAIDASIWMVQFMKAMRDEKGEMVRNAHVLGFFRRICKLLYLRTKPVFVFDGGTPALKRRTVIARRRQRENAQAKIRKTAEKLLLNQLKAMRLKELTQALEHQRQKQKQKNDGNVAKLLSNESFEAGMGSGAERLSTSSRSQDPGNIDEALASSIAAKNKDGATKYASTSAAVAPVEEEGDEDEEIILPTGNEDVDPVVFAALPPSIQLELIEQMNGPKHKKILSNDQDHINMLKCSGQRNKVASVNHDQQKLDEMLAASIAAEENGDETNKTSTSGPAILSEEENADDDEEFLLPVMHGNVDPAVLAALPPSMQLDLLGQMRERLMAENRQKYQKVKKTPEKFSELQIEAYLKTVAFRREIDEVQKAAAGRGFGGVQTSRIASEANREFIFSSSFTGDKQVLASARVEGIAEKNHNTQSRHHDLDSTCGNAAVSKSNSILGSILDGSRKALSSDVETYLDERGQVHVSRLTAMGIHMTRDLQRNLDLMKKIDQEKTTANKVENIEPMSNTEKAETPNSFSSDYLVAETSLGVDGKPINMDVGDDVSMVTSGTPIQITFEDDGVGTNFARDDDDEIFARLVAEVPLEIPADGTKKQSSHIDSDSDSDCEWVEMHIEGKVNSSADNNSGMKPSIGGNWVDESESDVEWEETPCNAIKTAAVCTGISEKSISKGCLLEEADLQEAIRRSLLDLGDEKSKNVLPEPENSNEFATILDKADITAGPDLTQQNGSLQQKSSVGYNFNNTGVSTNKPLNKSEQSRQAASEKGNLNREVLYAESLKTLSEVKKVHFLLDQCPDAYNSNFRLSTIANRNSKDISRSCDSVSSGIVDAILADKRNDSQADQSVLVSVKKNNVETESSTFTSDKENNLEPELYQYLTDMTDHSNSLVKSAGKKTAYDVNMEEIATGSSHVKDFTETEKSISRSATKDNENVQFEFDEASLEEEMLVLDQESRNLGDEQRRLERNAESVSSEMFAECQELLQIFGLPYIIAPMEAEAQCAYMELANLVDGVVTDDSDAFLFGAQSVYKNIFNDRKYVETYFIKDIEKELGLTREKFIRMALLLGSDYTEGVSGIGIVNAIEVVNAFPEEDGLQKFREWIESPDPSILGSFNGHAKANVKKIAKVGNNDFKSSMEGVDASRQKIYQADENQQSADDIQDIKQIFIDTHRNVSKNWHIPSSFPSEAVITAYSCPQVDKSTEPFSWGKPDILVLRKLCWEKFGWNSLKTEELLLPVLKEYGKRETQLRMEAFYSFNERFAKIRSKRIKKAVRGIAGTQALELMDDSKQEVPGGRKKRKVSSVENGDNKTGKLLDGNGETLNSMGTSTTKQSTKRGVHRKIVSSEVTDPEPALPTGRKQKTAKRSRENRGGRGRGRDYGIGKKGKGSRSFDLSETSSSDCHSGDDWQEVCSKNLKQAQEVRRSTRSRNPVNYNVDSLEVDDSGKSSSSKECHYEEIAKQDMQEVNNVEENVGPSPDGQKDHKVVDTPIIESLCGDYFQGGGGFFPVESENGQQCVGQDVEPCFEDRPSDDYLTMGGGFCTDETETVKEKNDSENPAGVGEHVESSTGFGLTGENYENVCSGESDSRFKRSLDELEANRKKIDREVNQEHQTTCAEEKYPNVGVALQENVKNDSGTASVGAFSAMPFLKRKRRKS